MLHDLQFRFASANGINIDDGGEASNPLAAHHFAIERLDIRNIGLTGNQDCLKISGVSDVGIRHSHFQDCGAGDGGIDFVGSHRGLVYANRLVILGASGVLLAFDITSTGLQLLGFTGFDAGLMRFAITQDRSA